MTEEARARKFLALRWGAGLSAEAAAEFLGVRPGTIQQWSTGRREPPPAVLDQLRGLISEQERYAESWARMMADGHLTFDEQLIYSDDDPRLDGWPSAAVANVAAARAWAMSVNLPPRQPSAPDPPPARRYRPSNR